MTDRELLELAAKAAGIDLNQVNGPIVNGGVRLQDNWNPLTDDGDALRLAVKLKLSLQIADHMTWYSLPDSDVWTAEEQEDLYAATRRAIVRAAAEIGEELK